MFSSWASTDILVPYQAPEEKENRKKNGEEDASNSQGELKAKRLYWDLVPLIRIAHALKNSLSDLIRAAEDVQDGLPPWFQMRITRGANERTTKELVNVFLEAVGCRTYVPRDPLNVKGQRKLRNHYRRELMPGDDLEVFFSEIDVSQMKFFAKYLLENRFLKDDFALQKTPPPSVLPSQECPCRTLFNSKPRTTDGAFSKNAL